VRQSYRRRLQILLANKLGTEVVHVVPNWMYRSGTDGGPERDIRDLRGTEMDWYRSGPPPGPEVPNASGTERGLPRPVSPLQTSNGHCNTRKNSCIAVVLPLCGPL